MPEGLKELTLRRVPVRVDAFIAGLLSTTLHGVKRADAFARWRPRQHRHRRRLAARLVAGVSQSTFAGDRFQELSAMKTFLSTLIVLGITLLAGAAQANEPR